MKVAAFWDTALCSLVEVNRRFIILSMRNILDCDCKKIPTYNKNYYELFDC
jgi:hypothetical protein